MSRGPAVAAGSLVASTELVKVLSALAADALGRTHQPAASLGFEFWRETSAGEVTGEDALEVFSSEAAFAAAARCALEARLAGVSADLESAFPHLYGSPLFSWYQPTPELSQRLSVALDFDAREDPAALLGWLYQFSIPRPVRSRFGRFYTSESIVRSMLDAVGFDRPEILTSRLIDPACGAGAFLIEATRRVLDQAEREGLAADETCASVQRIIHGLDLNPLGVLLTEAAIALLLAPYIAASSRRLELKPLHLYVTDALRVGELRAEVHGEDAEEIKTRTGAYEDGFSYVLANPPYAKHPSRFLSPQQAARFAETTYGHPNLYGLFLQVGVELLADRGRLAFINPKSFVSGLYFRNLRRFLTKHLDLERFDSFEKRTGLFDGVLQEVVILIGTKRAERVAEIELREFCRAADAPPARTIKASPSSVLLGPELDHAFFVSADSVAHSVLARMLACGRPLKEFGLEAVTGTIVWNRLKDLVRDDPAPDTVPLIWGNGIRAFRFLGLGNRWGRGRYCELVAKTESIVSYGEALLVKRMTAKEEYRRLVACRVPAELACSQRGYFGENHVNIVRARGSAQIELDAVLGLLNSRLFDYVFRALNGNTQVSATELEMLPIAQGPELAAIATQARKLTQTDGKDPKARVALDRLVYQLYGLDENEIGEIEGREARFAFAAAG